jgi:hypothetical protein
MSRRKTILWFVGVGFFLMLIASPRCEAQITKYTNLSTFQTASGATAEEPMPATGDLTSQVVGDMTFTDHPPSTLNFKNWTSFLPGFELALNDVESFNIDFASPLNALGFDWLDVSDDQDTSFTIDFLSGGSGGTNVGSSTFTSGGVENTALFQGFTNTSLFDRVQIREVGNDVQNEFFGQFYTGSSVVLNTNTGTIKGDGDNDPYAAYGVPFTTSFSSGRTTFRIAGDLNIPAGAYVSTTGINVASLLVANNVDIGAGATVDFSADGRFGGPGGGKGGVDPTLGGVGGNGAFAAGTGGLPGTGGVPGTFGTGGLFGGASLFGAAGAPSLELGLPDLTSGTPGISGLNSPGSGGAAGTNDPLQGGQVAFGGLSGGAGAISGTRPGGAGGAPGGGNGSPGFVGIVGNNGEDGGKGDDGDLGGGGIHTGSGTTISGGGGGGSGASGAGGGGAGSGGGGSGGSGGGGGGSFAQVFPPIIESGGPGGAGGTGGLGGSGGNGGTGARGGDGGGGAGAVEIIANGRVTIAGRLLARGADGSESPGNSGNPGGVGANGAAATAGSPGSGTAPAPEGGDGGAGGAGGKGGTGGHGGSGGDGGQGGGGAGGTVKVIGSVTHTGVAIVNTSGGAGGNGGGTGGANGRFIFGDNVVGDFDGTLEASTQSNASAPRDANPFVSGTPNTPFIPDLEGGAEVYGLTDLDADTDLTDVVYAAPANAIAALVYEDVGRGGFGDDYSGFDMLAVLNLSDGDLSDLMFGAGSSGFETGLLTGGIANNAEFGGDGVPDALILGSDEVYVTLVPTGTNDFQLSAMGFSASMAAMTDGDILFLVEGQPGDFDGDDDVDGADFLYWQRNDGTADGLLEWENNYGATPLSTVQNAVPEPGSIVLIALALGILIPAQRRT